MTDQPGLRDPEPNDDQPGEPADPWAGATAHGADVPGLNADQPDATRPSAGDGQTVERPAEFEGDETRPSSSVDETAVAPPSPRWSGRAQVPPPNVDQPDFAPADWSESEVQWRQRRGLATPLLLIAAALILLLLIAIGAYLVLNGSRETPVPPATTTPPGLTATSLPPTTPAQTTPPPTTTVAPVQVPVPAITGIDYPSALVALTQLGLRSNPVNEPSQDVPAGAVIRTDPVPGTLVDSGSAITVVVSTGPPQTTEASPSPSPTE